MRFLAFDAETLYCTKTGYTLRSANECNTVKVVADDRGDENGWVEHNFRFHSRPTK